MSKVTFKGSYWDNDGQYQKQYDTAWQTLIPAQGECSDSVAEALRCISRIGYDYYNNGFCNLFDRWDDIDDYGDDITHVKIDRYYQDMLDHLEYNVSRKLYTRLYNWIETQQDGCTWGKNGDHIIDEVIDDVLKQLMQDGTIPTA